MQSKEVHVSSFPLVYLVYPGDNKGLLDERDSSISVQGEELLHLLAVGNLRDCTQLLQGKITALGLL